MGDLTECSLAALAGFKTPGGEILTRRILLERGAFEKLPETVRSLMPFGKVLVVTAEDAAHLALPVAESLRREGFEAMTHVFPERFTADLKASGELMNYPEDVRVLVAVGGGNVTDAVRYAAAVLGREYVVLPTAPSGTGYLADVSVLFVDGLFRRFEAKAPYALLADPDVLAASPRALIAAGYGELAAVSAALFDWYFAYAVNGEAYDQEIAEAVKDAARRGLSAGDGLSRGAPGAAAALAESLLRVSAFSQLSGRVLESGVTATAYALSASSKKNGRHGRLFGEYCFLAGIRVTELYRFFCGNPVYDLALPPDKGMRACRGAELFGAGEYGLLSDALARDEDGYDVKAYRLGEYRDDLSSAAAEAYETFRGAEKAYRRTYEDLGYAAYRSLRPEDLKAAAALAPDTDSTFTALTLMRDMGLLEAYLK